MLAPHARHRRRRGSGRRAARPRYHRVLDGLARVRLSARASRPSSAPSTSRERARVEERAIADWSRSGPAADHPRAVAVRPASGVRRRQRCGRTVEAAIADAVDRDFLHVLANDCLASLPPLTFFQDAVVDSVGEHTPTFRLEHSALRPLVDVGRVFGMAARDALGRSTLERFATRAALLPEHEAIFREAADTLADRPVAAGTRRHQPGHVGCRAAAGAAQPARSPGAEERLPLDPSAARVHRRSQTG